MNLRRIYGWCANPEAYCRQAPKVHWLKTPSGESAHERLRLELDAPRTPLALVPLAYGELLRYARRGLLLPLSPLLDRARAPRPDEPFLSLCRVDGVPYGMPDDVEPYVLARWLGAEEAEGATAFSGLKEFERRVEPGPGALRIAVTGSAYNPRMGFLLSAFAAHGVRWDLPLERLLRQPEPLAEAYAWMLHATRNGGWLDEGTLTQSFDDQFKDRAAELFARRTCQAWAGWLNGLRSFSRAQAREVALSRFPARKHAAGKLKPVQPVHGKAWCIPLNTVEPEAALEALGLLLEPAFVKRLERESTICFTPYRALWSDPELAERRPFFRYASKLLDGPLLVFDRTDDAWRALEWALRTALAERAEPERFLDRLSGRERAPAGKGVKHPLVRQALRQIEANLSQLRGRDELAKLLGLTPDHLNRVFSHEMGESVGAYLMRRRLVLAKALLREPGASVKAVALRLGFRSSSYFSRAFKKQWGVPPISVQRS
ncbi:MAG: helix-turn-helix transcriptional regulator [Planctomycetes bacterium]|nr:helix-turn-helix transcriptional regulator [Planctomycetota bacterium]